MLTGKAGKTAMEPAWNDAKSFQRHLEDMRLFRLRHRSHLEGRLAPSRDLPILHRSCLANIKEINSYMSKKRKPTLVPVWEIVPPRNSQN
jgi:hypothetical protein